jgi:hypothetical protein
VALGRLQSIDLIRQVLDHEEVAGIYADDKENRLRFVEVLLEVLAGETDETLVKKGVEDLAWEVLGKV